MSDAYDGKVTIWIRKEDREQWDKVYSPEWLRQKLYEGSPSVDEQPDNRQQLREALSKRVKRPLPRGED